MTPAQNRNVTTSIACKMRQRESYPKGKPYGPFSIWSSIAGTNESCDVAIRPASINNAVRVDGTRPPSGWNHRWAVGRFPHKTVSFVVEGPWNRVNYEVQGPHMSMGIANFGWRDAVASVGGGWAVQKDFFPYGAEAAARTNFLTELAGNKADLGVALAEMKQTLGLVDSLARSFLNGLDSAVKAGKGLPKRVLREVLHFGRIPPRRRLEPSRLYNRRVRREKAVLNKWLEYQFGVKPLVRDIQDAAQALSDLLFVDQVPLRFTIRKGYGSMDRGISLKSGVAGFPNVVMQYRADVLTACHISATYDVPVSGVRTFNQLGLLNVASVAWEATKFSWLADYIGTTGKWLGSLSAREGVTFYEGSITKVQKVLFLDSRVLANPLSNTSMLEVDPWARTGLESCGQMTRDVLSDVFPALRPTVQNRLNLTRVANVLSVLALRARLS